MNSLVSIKISNLMKRMIYGLLLLFIIAMLFDIITTTSLRYDIGKLIAMSPNTLDKEDQLKLFEPWYYTVFIHIPYLLIGIGFMLLAKSIKLKKTEMIVKKLRFAGIISMLYFIVQGLCSLFLAPPTNLNNLDSLSLLFWGPILVIIPLYHNIYETLQDFSNFPGEYLVLLLVMPYLQLAKYLITLIFSVPLGIKGIWVINSVFYALQQLALLVFIIAFVKILVQANEFLLVTPTAKYVLHIAKTQKNQE